MDPLQFLVPAGQGSLHSDTRESFLKVTHCDAFLLIALRGSERNPPANVTVAPLVGTMPALAHSVAAGTARRKPPPRSVPKSRRRIYPS